MNECSCIWVDADPCFDAFWIKERKARKVHKCIECNKDILPGEKYEYFKGIYYEGGFEENKTCLDCKSIINAFFCDGYHFSMIMDDLKEHIDNMGAEISEDCIKGLNEGARAIVCELIEKEWKIWDEDDE